MKRVFYIDYRSPPSGIGQIENGDRYLNVRFDLRGSPGVRPDLQIDELVIDAKGETLEDYQVLVSNLRLLGVTHVSDSEMRYPNSEFTIDEWADVVATQL